MVYTKIYQDFPFCEQEIFRYAGCREAVQELTQLLQVCIQEGKPQFTYKVCYEILPFSKQDTNCRLGDICVTSHSLSKHLDGCDRVIIFAATIGIGIDRLIAKYGRISPVKALLFQAIGAERIETLCDAFCAEMQKEFGSTGIRFSPGYGDVPLEMQKALFAHLDCERKIGVVLNDSLFMSPSKSVTAIIGIGKKEQPVTASCRECGLKNCIYRG